MARPNKETLDYFQHDADASTKKTLRIMYNHFQHDGISLWWQLLENLSTSRKLFIDLRNNDIIEDLASKMHFVPEKMIEMIDKLASLDAIDQVLWEQRVIWCQNLIDRHEDLFNRWRNGKPEKPELMSTETELMSTETCIICGIDISGKREGAKYCSNVCRQKNNRVTDVTDKRNAQKGLMSEKPELMSTETELMSTETPENNTLIPQSKVKKRKEKKSKVKYVHPHFGEFQNVALTQEEYQKLLDRFGEANASTLIEELSSGIASKGYKYKCHYATIINWSKRDGKKGGHSERHGQEKSRTGGKPDWGDFRAITND